MQPPDDMRERIERLREVIRRHNRLYYVELKPAISDREFDALLDELRHLEAEHPEFATPDSPTRKVGGEPLDQFTAAAHLSPMLSIDNTYNEAEVRAFDRRVREKLGKGAPLAYVVELKVDGVAMNLIYRDGALAQAVTRGDGVRGDDVTQNARTIRGLPLRLHEQEGREYAPLAGSVIEVRGEAYMAFEDFRRVNEERRTAEEPQFANPRNATAGSLKLLDSRLTAARRLRIVTYEIGHCAGTAVPGSHWERLRWLSDHGCPTNPEAAQCSDIEAVLQKCAEWAGRVRTLKYPVDGLVVKVDSATQREELDHTERAWSWAIAYKFAAEQQETRLEHIQIQVGKSGQLTPVAVLRPVLLAGTTVSRASLHNFDEIERKDVRIGDQVLIEKAGEIIPQVVKALTERRTGQEQEIPRPTRCPSCGGSVRTEYSDKKLCANAKDKQKEECKGLLARVHVPVEEARCELCGGPVRLGPTAKRTRSMKVCWNVSCPKVGEAQPASRLPIERDSCAECGSAVVEAGKDKKKCVSDECQAAGKAKSRGYVPISEDRCGYCAGPVENAPTEATKRNWTVCADRTCRMARVEMPLPFLPPEKEKCEFCEGPMRIVALMYCDNPLCPGQAAERIIHYASRSAMDIEGLGEQTVLDFFEAGLLHGLPDIYSLAGTKDEIGKLRGYGARKAERILDGVERSKDAGLARLLVGLSIPSVGTYIASVLASEYGTMTALQAEAAAGLQITGVVGERIAGDIRRFFEQASTSELLEALAKAGVRMDAGKQRAETTGQLTGKTFVLTGTLERSTREQATARIEAAGGRVAGSVSKKTDYVVAGAEPGSKLDRARELGVRVLSEQEWEDLLGGP